ncbi:DUF6770 family protein [Dinghuibacter silviterrae]|uniref:Uncharacterized protein n=1 Tax=Dinghuibacter silviterrae TaxID=1539049 RepID=A0A4R8DR20_9BACT|nr:DUF6770 family protein [Dinghuibacter silviterrae]TDW99570.1 hypothetical protein EDB95_0580 [Dinghuibacter silviterrae]
MNYKKLLALLPLMLGSIALSAQSKLSIDNVYKTYLQNSGAIYQEGQIKGYFLFYQSDKVDKHTNEYSLDILDQNLNKVKEIKFDDNKKVDLLEAAYNGNALLFLYNDRENKILSAKIYGVDGTLKYTYTRPLDKRTEAFIQSYDPFKKTDDYVNTKVFSCTDQGFTLVLPLKDGRQETFEIDYYSSEKQYQYAYTSETEGRFEQAAYLGNTDSLILVEVERKEHQMSGQPHSSVMAVNYITKKKAFDIEDTRDKYKFVPLYCSKFRLENGNFLLMGSYFDKNANIFKDASLGIAMYNVTSTGDIVSTTFNSWAQDISKYLPLNEKGRIDHIGYLFFHNMIQTPDGNLFAVGEGYKRTADAMGITMNVLGGGGGAGYTEIRVTDMVILKFTPDYKIAGATIQQKNYNTVHTALADLNSQHLLAMIIKSYGGFDYAFTTTDPSSGNFDVCYSDYEKEKEYHGMTFHSLRYDGKTFTGDKIELKTKASNQRVLPGQPGFVMVYEYFKKDKRIDLRLEKLN